jgi:hypothetical protein
VPDSLGPGLASGPGGLGSGPGGGSGPALGGSGGGPSSSGSKTKKITQKDIDKAACEAYRALAKQFGGIPTGRTEAGGKLYIDNGSVKFSDFVSYTPEKGQKRGLPNVWTIRVPNEVGYIHTHPKTHYFYDDGTKIPKHMLPWANLSWGDISVLHDGFPYSNRSGYATTSEFWKSGQIIRFKTEDGIYGTYEMIDCNKLLR